MYAKTLLLVLLLLVLNLDSLKAQQIDLKLKNKVDSMVVADQFYRLKMSDLYAQYHKSKKTDTFRSRRYKSLQESEIIDHTKTQEYENKEDSLRILRNETDASNIQALKRIILAKGYPGKKIVGHYDIDLILLHSNLEWIKEMLPALKAEVKKGNLRAITLANAYDKFSFGYGEGYLYHTLLHVDKNNKITQTTPDDLVKTNAARKEIGLKPIKLKKNGQRKN